MQTFQTKRDAGKYAYENNLSADIYPYWDSVLEAWVLKEFQPRLFRVGDKVKTESFRDERGNGWGCNDILTVISIQTISPLESGVPHHRIKARAENGNQYEGAEMFFRSA